MISGLRVSTPPERVTANSSVYEKLLLWMLYQSISGIVGLTFSRLQIQLQECRRTNGHTFFVGGQ